MTGTRGPRTAASGLPLHILDILRRWWDLSDEQSWSADAIIACLHIRNLPIHDRRRVYRALRVLWINGLIDRDTTVTPYRYTYKEPTP